MGSARKVLVAGWYDGEACRLLSDGTSEAWRSGCWIEIEPGPSWPAQAPPISIDRAESVGLTEEKLLYVAPRPVWRDRVRAMHAWSGPHRPTVPIDYNSFAYRIGLALRRALGLPILPWWYRNQLEAAQVLERCRKEMQLRAPAVANEPIAFAPRASPDTRSEDLEDFRPARGERVPSEAERQLAARMLEALDRSEDNLVRGAREGLRRRRQKQAAEEALRATAPDLETSAKKPRSTDKPVPLDQMDPDDVSALGFIKGIDRAMARRRADEALRAIAPLPELSSEPSVESDPVVLAELAELRSEFEAELEDTHGPEWMRDHAVRLGAEWRRAARRFAEIPEPSRE